MTLKHQGIIYYAIHQLPAYKTAEGDKTRYANKTEKCFTNTFLLFLHQGQHLHHREQLPDLW